jgi:hypothetical protein
MMKAPRRCRAGEAAFAVAQLASWPHLASAYVAAGDRTFPAMILLPQVAPADQFYVTPATQPTAEGRSTDVAINFAKTLTERLGCGSRRTTPGSGATVRRPRAAGRTWRWSHNISRFSPRRTKGWCRSASIASGAAPARQVGASPQGATTPTVYFAKGMGDLDIGYLRPLVVTGSIGHQFADALPRPDHLLTGIAVEYSIPYLQSKVRALPLPDVVRERRRWSRPLS